MFLYTQYITPISITLLLQRYKHVSVHSIHQPSIYHTVAVQIEICFCTLNTSPQYLSHGCCKDTNMFLYTQYITSVSITLLLQRYKHVSVHSIHDPNIYHIVAVKIETFFSTLNTSPQYLSHCCCKNRNMFLYIYPSIQHIVAAKTETIKHVSVHSIHHPSIYHIVAVKIQTSFCTLNTSPQYLSHCCCKDTNMFPYIQYITPVFLSHCCCKDTNMFLYT